MTDINVDRFGEALNDKLDRDGNNAATGALENMARTSGGDFVVEWKMPTDNDPTWYRLYNSGWVEQGSTLTPTTNPTQIILTFPMANTNYNIQLSVQDTSPTDSALTVGSWNDKTVTGFKIYEGYNGNSQTMPVSWEVKGMSDLTES